MSARTELAGLEQSLHADIPLARHMQVSVLAADAQGLTLSAPLAPNANDKGTAFGGSLYSLAVLAGWALASRQLRARGIECQIVIQESFVEYLQPVSVDFQARALAPDSVALERCLKTLARYGRARIDIGVVIEAGGAIAARLQGRYVIEAPGTRA